ncbi:hypothetical protein SLEP1_g22325 [Rubroshorea leprosula]|uniref:Uncharacterized protein n=1 Tax=Rubroshorea leprosula TaxID=152421 RepID=A0AAV5JBU1_9ROSI|nr:hypothetical protein SLEP1_g22325 [Rubroshorea leprosula]
MSLSSLLEDESLLQLHLPKAPKLPTSILERKIEIPDLLCVFLPLPSASCSLCEFLGIFLILDRSVSLALRSSLRLYAIEEAKPRMGKSREVTS